MKKNISLGIILAGFIALAGGSAYADSSANSADQEAQTQSLTSDTQSNNHEPLDDATKVEKNDGKNKKTKVNCGPSGLSCGWTNGTTASSGPFS